MGNSFKGFCENCHDALIENSGLEGRKKVLLNLEQFLSDGEQTEEFSSAGWPRGTTCLHHDPETGIYVWAHNHPKNGSRGPHDHGSTWAIYSTVSGHAHMTEWRRRDDGSKPGYAALSPDKTYSLGPGMAALYNEGVIHSAKYPAGTRLIRVTGKDLNQETVKRFKPERHLVVEHNRAKAIDGAL